MYERRVYLSNYALVIDLFYFETGICAWYCPFLSLSMNCVRL